MEQFTPKAEGLGPYLCLCQYAQHFVETNSDFAQPVASVPVKLPGGKTFRVAFAGLITSSTPQQTSKRNVNGLTFDGNYPAVLDSVMKLPEHTLIDDAHLRLLLTHIGSRTNEDGQPVWDDKDRENPEPLERYDLGRIHFGSLTPTRVWTYQCCTVSYCAGTEPW